MELKPLSPKICVRSALATSLRPPRSGICNPGAGPRSVSRACGPFLRPSAAIRLDGHKLVADRLQPLPRLRSDDILRGDDQYALTVSHSILRIGMPIRSL